MVTPSEFICPLSKQRMQDPVSTKWGQVFERQAIIEWISSGKKYCPITGCPLRIVDLSSNKPLRKKIEKWQATRKQSQTPKRKSSRSSSSSSSSAKPEITAADMDILELFDSISNDNRRSSSSSKRSSRSQQRMEDEFNSSILSLLDEVDGLLAS